MTDGRDHWWHDLVPGQSTDCEPEPMDSEDLLYLLYTSGTTGKPKGIMHTTGGYLTQVAFTHRYVFDIHEDTDVYWCAADIGWVTGHSYIVYGPLANRTTSVMYEGTPNHPHEDRYWDIIERYGVTQFYTAPTSIRAFMKWGEEHPAEARPVVAEAPRHGRRADQPRGLGLVPRDHRRRVVPGRRHVVADRDRRHHDQPAPRGHHHQAGLGDLPAPRDLRRRGRRAAASRPASRAAATSSSTSRGRRCCAASGATTSATATPTGRGSTGRYFAGDGAKRDEDGYYWLLGRVDDVMNISGHRISTTEVESALVSHPSVAEAAVIGRHDAQTGQAIAAFVTPRGGTPATRRSPRSCATTSPRSSPRSRSRRRCCSPTTCRRPAPARSCGGC